MKKIYIHSPKPLKRKARENVNFDYKQLDKELTIKMLNPFYFTDGALRVRFDENIDSRHNNRANSELTIKPSYPEFGFEPRYKKNHKRIICYLC